MCVCRAPAAVDKCKALILRACEEEEKAPPTSADTKTIRIPHDQVGKIIGKGGITIKQIQNLSKAHIDIQKDPVPGTNPPVAKFVLPPPVSVSPLRLGTRGLQYVQKCHPLTI